MKNISQWQLLLLLSSTVIHAILDVWKGSEYISADISSKKEL